MGVCQGDEDVKINFHNTIFSLTLLEGNNDCNQEA